MTQDSRPITLSNRVFKFLFVFAVILLITAVLAPAVFAITHIKFERIILRLVMVFTFLAVIVLGKAKFDFKKYGLGWRKDSLRLFCSGFLVTFLCLVFLAAAEAFLGAQKWSLSLSPGRLAVKFLAALLSGFIVGFVEELFFRGYIFEKVSGKLKILAGFVVTNIFYSATHFLRAKTVITGEHPDVWMSFRVMADFFTPLVHFQSIYQPFIGLFIFGLLLSSLYLWSGRNLILPISVHAATVFYQKIDGNFISYVGPNGSFLYGGGDIRSSLIAWVLVGLITSWFFIGFFVRKARQSERC
ncbi:MAG: type II CAAX endopeptidase family protein [Candidatus Omnitrophica bacterium]|nr:type II CAAX endopeptidase family protein [Candidatus Omnitrophota bacterium]